MAVIRPKQPCPHCGYRLSRVKDSQGEVPRSLDAQLLWRGEGPWRERECARCGCVFGTEEVTRGILRLPQSA